MDDVAGAVRGVQWKWLIAGVATLIPAQLVVALLGRRKSPMTGKAYLLTLLLMSSTRPVIFAVAHVVYFGPVLLLLVDGRVRNRVVELLHALGPGWVVFALGAWAMSLDSESRHASFHYPLIVSLIVWSVDRTALTTNRRALKTVAPHQRRPGRHAIPLLGARTVLSLLHAGRPLDARPLLRAAGVRAGRHGSRVVDGGATSRSTVAARARAGARLTLGARPFPTGVGRRGPRCVGGEPASVGRSSLTQRRRRYGRSRLALSEGARLEGSPEKLTRSPRDLRVFRRVRRTRGSVGSSPA